MTPTGSVSVGDEMKGGGRKSSVVVVVVVVSRGAVKEGKERVEDPRLGAGTAEDSKHGKSGGG